MPNQEPKKRSNKSPIVLAVCIVVLAVGAGLAVWAQNRSAGPDTAGNPAVPEDDSASYIVTEVPSGAPESVAPEGPAAVETAAPLPEEMRGMWISYLEWLKNDISTEEKLREVVQRMFGECRDMGLNTVIVQVRPFSDAFYPSEYFPWSHHLTDEQGEDPGYDPLAVMVEEAHAHGLRFEAWVNPYRIDLDGGDLGPGELSDDNPAVLHPEWVREVEESGVWYDPGIPEVQQLIVDGVREIAEKYDVDGIHIDDYFYPAFTAEQIEDGEDVAFDEDTYAQYGEGQDLAAWRRENVNTLVRSCYDAIKQVDPEISFGISPQGNNDNNYNQQYSDVKLWMETPGYVDYVMPQLYWGFNYRLQNGSDRYAFGNITAEWAGYPRHESVRLYAGLGAYRIEEGDGGDNDQAEWESGHNLADMAEHLRGVDGFTGFALFRYEVLYGRDASDLAEDEIAALTEMLGGPPAAQSTPQSSSDTT
ncbi:family 10 glycosylhydrolase [Ruminococcaceae bacterium OttesenSCG-928-I18]|nr:family 10 glycosylhydrolase [Ruminococcaceae bacterium OttesenSCG-928-I18]